MGRGTKNGNNFGHGNGSRTGTPDVSPGEAIRQLQGLEDMYANLKAAPGARAFDLRSQEINREIAAIEATRQGGTVLINGVRREAYASQIVNAAIATADSPMRKIARMNEARAADIADQNSTARATFRYKVAAASIGASQLEATRSAVLNSVKGKSPPSLSQVVLALQKRSGSMLNQDLVNAGKDVVAQARK